MSEYIVSRVARTEVVFDIEELKNTYSIDWMEALEEEMDDESFIHYLISNYGFDYLLENTDQSTDEIDFFIELY